MQNMMTRIREDMPVYDSTGTRIGVVKAVHFGDEDLERPGAETQTAQKPQVRGNTFVDKFAEALTLGNDVPEELRKRLERFGYFRVGTGLLVSDRYASADQIAKVDVDRVDLTATMDELIKT
ncbi:MAG: hypothetical protein GYB65_21025 [Chloroflexi bacterium]|nr:hypothetical protein [Chloroflexota bacterium]